VATILLFEDDATLAESWQNILESRGHQVEHTTNVDVAMAKVYTGTIDIAFVDIFIRKGSQQIPRGGIMLISKIHMLSIDPKPWLIAISGRSHDSSLSVLDVAKNVGADEYLKKPIGLPLLLSTVDRVIAAQAL